MPALVGGVFGLLERVALRHCLIGAGIGLGMGVLAYVGTLGRRDYIYKKYKKKLESLQGYIEGARSNSVDSRMQSVSENRVPVLNNSNSKDPRTVHHLGLDALDELEGSDELSMEGLKISNIPADS